MNPIKLFCKDRELKNRIASRRERLYRIAYSWCHDRELSDDLTQDTLSKALKNISSLRNPDSLDCWLYGILSNCWRDHFRRNRNFEDVDDFVFTNDTTPERDYEHETMTNTILDAVATLPVGQRQVLTLVDLEGFSYAEVSSILDVPIGTIMSRLCRARKSLTEKLLDLKSHAAEERSAFLRRVK